MEDQNHIIWHCPFTCDVWVECSKWLDMNLLPPETGNITECLRRGSKLHKSGGGLCLAAIIWSIWTARNELLYQDILSPVHRVMEQIKFRSFCWAKTANIVSKEDFTSWCVSPLSAMNVYSLKSLKSTADYWLHFVDFIGLVDGANQNSISSSAGMGGYILDKHNKVVFIFSGPINSTSGIDSKLEALFYLLKAFYNSEWRNTKMAVLVDSLNLVRTFTTSKLHLSESLRKWIQNIKLVHMDCISGSAAAQMAKEGRSREKIVEAWIF